jgi:hypothetical protein
VVGCCECGDEPLDSGATAGLYQVMRVRCHVIQVNSVSRGRFH